MILLFLIFISFLINNPSTINQSDAYLVDDFTVPLQEEWQGRDKGFEIVYKIVDSPDNSYLSAKSIDSDNFIVKRITVDITEYPYLNWRWRIKTLPLEGDESKKEKCDVAASISLVLNANKFLPKSIKYSWSSTLNKGLSSCSPFAIWPSRCDISVVESGDSLMNKWVYEKVNVLEDYKRFYKKSKVKKKLIRAIVIMTDSDNTSSLSEADYDDIYFSKS